MKFYNQKYPDVDDIVTCLVNKIEKDVIYVELLEYDNIQGMIQYSNASTRKKKKIICTVKENKIHPLLVLAIDKEKGYIDLSNKYLSDEEKDISMEKYNFPFILCKSSLNFNIPALDLLLKYSGI